MGLECPLPPKRTHTPRAPCTYLTSLSPSDAATPQILSNYGRSIAAGGHSHALHSLSRMITLYCDFGANMVPPQQGAGANSVKDRTTKAEVRPHMPHSYLLAHFQPLSPRMVPWLQS